MKKGFTIFELLLVVLILGLLMAAFSNFFLNNRERNRIYFDTCVARTYGEINTFLGEALTQKTVYKGTSFEAPELYTLFFDDDNQRLEFKHDFTDQSGLMEDAFVYSGTLGRDSENRCWDGAYQTRIKSDNLVVDMAPGFKQGVRDGDSNSFDINNDDGATITGEVLFLFCDGPFCMEKSKIIFDKRSQTANLKLCLRNEGQSIDCSEWTK